MNSMNWVDLVIIGALIFFALEAIGRSFILELLDFLSFLVAFFISFSYYNLFSKFFETNFQIPHGLSLVLGFMAMWFIAETSIYLLIRMLLPRLPKIRIPWANTLSILPALLRGLIFIALTLVLIATFPIQPAIKKAVLNSKIGSQILKNAYQLEQPVKNVFGGVTEDSLTFLTIKPQTSEKVNLGFQTTEYSQDEAAEKVMIELLNKERISRGLPVLVFDGRLVEVGRKHSRDMFERGYFSHYSPEGESVADRATEAGIDFLVVGENLAYAPNVDLAHRGLMNSEGHRANILSEDFGKIGVGVVDGGVYGKMFTQVFTNATTAAVVGIAGERVLVTKVIDGDTIEIEGGIKVRLLGIDTPETKDPRRSVECFGKEAANETKRLLEGSMVILEKDLSETDKYRRLLRYVFLPLDPESSSGQMLFVNDYLIREGFAKTLTYPPDVKYSQALLEAQTAAKVNNKGLWARC